MASWCSRKRVVLRQLHPGPEQGRCGSPDRQQLGRGVRAVQDQQYEVGTKVDFGRFTATLAAFQITKPSGQLAGNVFSVNGEQRNRGLELNLFVRGRARCAAAGRRGADRRRDHPVRCRERGRQDSDRRAAGPGQPWRGMGPAVGGGPPGP
ncbi:hypothetical protein ACTMU2_11695 [Cupriavidus basilensis]